MPVSKKRREYMTKYLREVWYPKNRKAHISRVGKNNRDFSKKLAEYKAGKSCVRCGESDPVCLDFHHLRDKVIEVSVAVSKRWSWKRIEAEISKCVLLCANCHRKEHATSSLKAHR